MYELLCDLLSESNPRKPEISEKFKTARNDNWGQRLTLKTEDLPILV